MDFPVGYIHVTEALALSGIVDTQWFTEESRARGTAVQLATRFLDEGDLDSSSVDPAILPRLRSYERFKAEVQPEILTIEEPVVNTTYRYCGTLDRRVRINRREGILDIKGLPASSHGPQTAGYAGCFIGGERFARWGLYLQDDGYRLIEFTGREDWSVFLASLTIASWRRIHG